MAEPLILLNNVTRHFVAGTQLIPVLKSISDHYARRDGGDYGRFRLG
jgi:hypothetical protein